MFSCRLENAQSFDELRRKNASVVDLRARVTCARRRRFSLQESLKAEESRGAGLRAELARLGRAAEALREREAPRLRAQVAEEEARAGRLGRMADGEGRDGKVPTVDDYFRVKLEQERRRNRQKVNSSRYCNLVAG